MTGPILYITGTNTNVGKTFLSVHLLRHARQRGVTMAAMKPFCSGGRDDAIQLHALQTAGLTLDQVNPFHFEEPITPLQAARNAGRAIDPPAVISAVKSIAALGHPSLLEGAGGLLSPLCENFTMRDLITALPGHVMIVAPNTLGVINSVLLTMEALPASGARSVVLMQADTADESTATNADLIREFSRAPVFGFPFLKSSTVPPGAVLDVILSNFLNP